LSKKKQLCREVFLLISTQQRNTLHQILNSRTKQWPGWATRTANHWYQSADSRRWHNKSTTCRWRKHGLIADTFPRAPHQMISWWTRDIISQDLPSFSS